MFLWFPKKNKNLFPFLSLGQRTRVCEQSVAQLPLQLQDLENEDGMATVEDSKKFVGYLAMYFWRGISPPPPPTHKK